MVLRFSFGVLYLTVLTYKKTVNDVTLWSCQLMLYERYLWVVLANKDCFCKDYYFKRNCLTCYQTYKYIIVAFVRKISPIIEIWWTVSLVYI